MALRSRLAHPVITLAAAFFIALALVPFTATTARAATPVCLQGRFSYAYQSAEAGTTKPTFTKYVRAANVELWGAEKSNDTPRWLGVSQLTSDDGAYNLCYTPTTTVTMNKVWVRVWSESRRLWRVIDSANNAYFTQDSQTLTDVGGGTYSLPGVFATGIAGRGWHALDTVYDLWRKRDNTVSNCWTAGEPDNNACTRLEIRVSDGTTSAEYNPWSNTVYLDGEAADSEHTILHEAGHFLLHRLYDGVWPNVDNCNPHYIPTASSETCAWTEGFADATAAYVLNDYDYVHPNGVYVPIQYGPGWEIGDQVQGNVAGSLLRLWRLVENGWGPTLTAVAAQKPTTFSQYFNTTRPNAGMSTTGMALLLVSRSAVDYGPSPVGDGKAHGLSNGGRWGLERAGGCAATAPANVRISKYAPAYNSSHWKIDANADGTVRVSDNCAQPLTLTAPTAAGSTVTAKPFSPADVYQKWTVTRKNGTFRMTNPQTGLVLATTGIDQDSPAVAQTPGSANVQGWVRPF
ncbi:ricin-type beta-trefoil lectin domain protein [Streptomyces sp. NBC_00654]|uniref:RICIN domain-containing protein n=1 Tax=Streptomyces sp. NBC_00654 TaxID=2975799 RepID=UPI002252C1EF|nr:RICIN domain-containing protein [Streptomyces sp. NBC_00654]MCX4967170.1 ricin-type beta-trefoil lectin domain protein [Streptomyces sp. NBC_00654]